MNCQEFQNYFNDDRAKRTSSEEVEAQSHAQSCRACGDFAREQNLTNCLRGFAASTAACQLSPAVEDALRQAFRQHNAPQVAVSNVDVYDDMRNEVTGAPALYKQESHKKASKQVGINHLIYSQMASMWQMHRSVFASLMISVVGLAAFGVFAPRWQSSEQVNEKTAFSAPIARQPAAPQNFATRQLASQETITSSSPRDLAADAIPINDTPALVQTASYSDRRRSTTPRPKFNGDTMRESKFAAPEYGSVNEQVATQFFPLDDNLSMPIESGHLMKIEMPRSALASFGLPTTIERANETVKAEVLVGTDGIAHAIRFVR